MLLQSCQNMEYKHEQFSSNYSRTEEKVTLFQEPEKYKYAAPVISRSHVRLQIKLAGVKKTFTLSQQAIFSLHFLGKKHDQH